jgi:DNA-binding MurR/RpiR family transcriptional regulator
MRQTHVHAESFRDRVAARRPALSPGSQRIADYLLAAGPEVVLLSAAELASALGTSDASIVRTAKALGYGGLAELRRHISASAPDPTLPERLRRSLAEGAAGESTLQMLIAQHLGSLDGLARRVPPPLLVSAVEVLGAADRIVWCGTGPSAAIAEYGATLAARLGHPSSVARGSGTQLADELLAMRPGDAVVLLAYGRADERPRAVVTRCDAVGIPTVLLTDAPSRELGERVTVVLPCGRGTPGLFSSHGTTLVLIEALVLGMAAADPPRAEASLALLNDLRAEAVGRRRDVYRGR